MSHDPGIPAVGLRKYVIEDILKSVPGEHHHHLQQRLPAVSDFPVFKLMFVDFLMGQFLIGPLITTCWRGAWISLNVFLDDHLFKVHTCMSVFKLFLPI